MLGSFLVSRAGIPLAGFESNKVRALLAYLAVETDRPHQRRKLAALLWPEFPESTALSNLRYALSNLRKVIGDRTALPAYLQIDPQTIRFNLSSNCTVDVSKFEHYCLLANQNPLDFTILEMAAGLHHGSFIEGSSVPDSSAFEEWVVMKREHLDRLAMQVFSRLANDLELSGEYKQAIHFTEMQIELDPWGEEAHRRLMRCLCYTGQRSAALVHYETCRRELAKELAVAPEQATQKLYKNILEDKLQLAPSLPSFLRHATYLSAERPHFIARKAPLVRMHQVLKQAVAGRGQLLLITGSPGQGKTALVQEFMHQALEEYSSLAAAWGNCRAYFGSGDPCLPFREIIEILTGQVEHLWEAGSISQDHAQRLWRLTAYSAQALVQEGPDLIGTFLSGRDLYQRASLVTQPDMTWLSDLRTQVERQVGGPTTQQDLFLQYWRVLAEISRHTPLFLFVDDLQWADQSSLTLLFRLAHEVNNAPIMIVGAFRPFEESPYAHTLSLSLATMITELRLLHGDMLIDLDELEERDFIDAYLDLEPNLLDETFREELYRYTHGHPLFTLEMLYGMRERGDLVKNAYGEWVKSQALCWDNMPPKVDAAIAERLRQLPQPMLDLLQIASIEGERFTAEIVAISQGIDEQQVITQLNSELDHHYKLVQADSTRRVHGNRISQFRFRHILYQRYLYSQLNAVERSHLHERVGNVMERYYSNALDQVAVQLAIHFELAAAPLKAIHYLQMAGIQATHLSGFEDAIIHLRKALALLQDQPQSFEKDTQELELLKYLDVPIMLARGYASPELGNVNNRMLELLNCLPQKPEMFPIIMSLGSYYVMCADYSKLAAILHLGKLISENGGNEFYLRSLDFGIGYGLIWQGEIQQALPHFERMIEFYDPTKHSEMRHMIGTDLGIVSLTWASWALWLLGYPSRALTYSNRAIDIGLVLKDPASQATSQVLAIYLHLFLNDLTGVADLFQSCSSVLAQYQLPLLSASLEFIEGYYLLLSGELAIGLEMMSRGVRDYQALGTRNLLSMLFTLFADAHLRNGHVDQAALVLKQTQDFTAETGETFYQAETLRVKGEMLLQQSPAEPQEAEDYFNQALQVAHKQEAKSLELRAAMSLARLRSSQGRQSEARQVLLDVYNWFTEGFNTPDLKEARAILDTVQ